MPCRPDLQAEVNIHILVTRVRDDFLPIQTTCARILVYVNPRTPNYTAVLLALNLSVRV